MTTDLAVIAADPSALDALAAAMRSVPKFARAAGFDPASLSERDLELVLLGARCGAAAAFANAAVFVHAVAEQAQADDALGAPPCVAAS